MLFTEPFDLTATTLVERGTEFRSDLIDFLLPKTTR